MKAATVYACVAFCMLTYPAGAGEYATYGPGANSCGKWVKAEEMSRAVGMSWVLGFMTAMNFRNGRSGNQHTDVTHGTDADSLELWLVNYCSEHPLEDLNAATLSLYFELVK
ncbi:hypothetical protein LB559_13370 [Mesorhizobium sp. BR1-1-3]|uniref:hypothetical protein n=1 Tax=Mesorhizobium sp. BR1-1-3 TaxID=2876651 RepID=UPI001CD0C463|nr:hypothetical protein [Mesorhizobium sp. BR1-1-3]MBZ9888933.1 hypothetical protein [Mesorhizobium sp. BR1-1-3]